MTDNAIEECIKDCWDCRHQCQKDLYGMCVEQGGQHVAPDHVCLMTDCIEICQQAADFMTRGSDHHQAICRACAEICDACSQSCRDLDMAECADACRVCAISCRRMSEPGQAKAAA